MTCLGIGKWHSQWEVFPKVGILNSLAAFSSQGLEGRCQALESRLCPRAAEV